MDQAEKDKGTIFVLIERFNKQRLPRALEMKKRVDAGEVLTEFDQALINEVQEEMKSVTTIVARNPQYEELAAKVMHLWEEIIAKGLENMKKQDL